jgi:DNA polymerase-3 subunit epsilon
MLVEEFLRTDIDFSLSNRKVVDVQKIFHLMEPRTLSAAYTFYCDKSLDNAHSAEADTIATYEVLLSQIEKYEGVKIKDAKKQEIEPVKNDISTLHDLAKTKFADFAGRIAYNDQGEEVFNFGKHKNKTVTEVLLKEPAYYDWMMRGDFPLYTKKILTEIKLRSFSK